MRGMARDTKWVTIQYTTQACVVSPVSSCLQHHRHAPFLPPLTLTLSMPTGPCCHVPLGKLTPTPSAMAKPPVVHREWSRWVLSNAHQGTCSGAALSPPITYRMCTYRLGTLRLRPVQQVERDGGVVRRKSLPALPCQDITVRSAAIRALWRRRNRALTTHDTLPGTNTHITPPLRHNTPAAKSGWS